MEGWKQGREINLDLDEEINLEGRCLKCKKKKELADLSSMGGGQNREREKKNKKKVTLKRLFSKLQFTNNVKVRLSKRTTRKTRGLTRL